MTKTTRARTCGICPKPLPAESPRHQRWCSTQHRQAAWRLRQEGPGKVCTSCRVQKPHGDYQRKRSNVDGLQSRCRECQNAAMKKHYEDNHGDYLTRRAGWRATPERRELLWAQGVETRARSFGVPVVERVRRLDVFQRDGWLCTLCGEPMVRETGQNPRSATVDHTVPLAEGGRHVLENCRSAHRQCNREKWNHPLTDFWARQWLNVEGRSMPLGRAVIWAILTPEPGALGPSASGTHARLATTPSV